MQLVLTYVQSSSFSRAMPNIAVSFAREYIWTIWTCLLELGNIKSFFSENLAHKSFVIPIWLQVHVIGVRNLNMSESVEKSLVLKIKSFKSSETNTFYKTDLFYADIWVQVCLCKGTTITYKNVFIFFVWWIY